MMMEWIWLMRFLLGRSRNLERGIGMMYVVLCFWFWLWLVEYLWAPVMLPVFRLPILFFF